MTEQEAKTKWCPFARVGSETTGLGSINRDVRKVANFDSVHCIGSACMAFRQHGWRDKEDGQFKSMIYEKADATHWEPMFHCGLAGKP